MSDDSSFEGEKVKVAVVTFGSLVTVKHKGKDIQISNHLYYDFEGIAVEADKISDQFALPIQTNHQHF